MKIIRLIYLLCILLLVACGGKNGNSGDGKHAAEACGPWTLSAPSGVEVAVADIDTMCLSNPFITYDVKSNGYYMVTDGGYMWTSKDLRSWTGPFEVLKQDTSSWVGASPVITSPEIHKYGNRYYYMATFEVPGSIANDADGKPFTRRSCVALVADTIIGPYRTIDKDSELLVVEEMAAHPTFCTDDLDVGYMIYNHMGEQNGDATVQIIRFTPDLAHRMGEAYIMFSASQNSWSKAHINGKEQFSPIIESPYIFITGDYVLGILFNTYVDDVRTTGVAYSQTGSLNGPWVIDAEPLLPAGMAVSGMFDDYDGTPVLVASTDTIIGGEKRSVTRLLKADTEFDKLQIKGYYKF